ncbi:hypothetical protein ACFULT_26575 [Rhodococcus sp. NPDC057297]|uniref:hypothetical protein n=1 Tax=Rhodococcus sp. NPDC057297 TaxID=3346090 RepID=UPI00362A2112
MIEVRIRTEYEAQSEGKRLTFVPFDKLDTVIPTIEKWGGVTTNGETFDGDFYGQFVVADGAAFFEVVFDPSDDAE